MGGMIRIAGEDWGTAMEVAEYLGHGVTPEDVIRWADGGALTASRPAGDSSLPIRYLAGQAAGLHRAALKLERADPVKAF